MRPYICLNPMTWLSNLLNTPSVAHDVLILSLVAIGGLALGSLRIKGIGLGIAGVLFAGLLLGHFGFIVSPEVLDFARDLGLILFVYALGMQVGPGFIGSLRHHGLPLNALALALVLLGVLTTLAVARLGHIPMPVAVGLFSGGTTNTPSLAAAQQALKELPGAAAAAAMPGMGYAVSYPFGVLGIIFTLLLTRFALRGHLTDKTERSDEDAKSLESMSIEVQNANLDGLEIRQLPRFKNSGVVVSRVQHEENIKIARDETRIYIGDILLAVGEESKLREFQVIVGKPSELDLREVGGPIATRRILVTRRQVLGKSIQQLNWAARYGAVVTRVVRAGIELAPRKRLRLQFGDVLLAVGGEEVLTQVAQEAGDSPKELEHPSMLTLFIGIGLGVLVGSWPIFLPGMPAPIKLGLAGGPLLVAITLSSLGRIGPLLWHLPNSAGVALREFGIALFLAGVGLKAGDAFVPTLLQGGGFVWMAWAALITLVPLFITAIAARWWLKLSFPALCGLLAGGMTDPPALAFAHNITDSDTPAITYATVYPLVMIARIVSAQILIIFFS